METVPPVNFTDTEVAFSYKSDRELKKANFIFSVVNHPGISAVATGLARISLALRLPVKGIIRRTVFEHFCGGETAEDTVMTIDKLAHHHVGAILDYSVEGEHDERSFDSTTAEILKTFDVAKDHPSIPFCVFKMTGLARFELLERVHAGASLSDAEQAEFARVKSRVDSICKKAHTLGIPVLIDAEDSWIQRPIDGIAHAMMREYNQEKAIVYNTYQMYRSDMLGSLKNAFHEAAMYNYFLGAKLVRGAYMEKERERAAEKNYPNPIQPTKEATDDAFNKALAFCVDNKQRVSVMCGSHNEYSNHYLTILMNKHGMRNDDKRVWFAQLLGMSDNISFNLAKAGYNVAKYVPYGPVESVMPYLLRRAAENTSVAGQSSRELTLIKKELKRRKL